MKTIRNNSLLRAFALGVLVFCLSATVANAQICSGKFTLPADVRWGLATLQAGNYTFNLDGARAGDMVRVFQNGKVVAMLLPTSYTPAADGPAVLVIENGKSGSTVREIRLPDSGVALYYGPHRPKHGTAAEEREVAQLIPITTANASR